MYYDFIVPIPEVKGKITLMRKGKLTYIQLETDRVYYPKRGIQYRKEYQLERLMQNIRE